MAAAGENHQLVGITAAVNQGIQQFHGIGEVHVVVAGAVHEHQFAFDVFGLVDGRGIFVPLGVVLGTSHVALGVNGVVQLPVAYRRVGNSQLENVWSVKERFQSHVTAVAAAGD